LDIGSDPSSDSARRAVADLVRLGSAEVGLRLELGGDETAATALLAQFAAGSFLVLAPGAGASAGEWPSFIQRFARQRGLRILAEVGSADEAAAAQASHVDGLIAKGSEAGGRAAHATTFVLLQELLQRFTIPVWAQGGIDDHTAAACAAAGAAGVVLCDELALVRESMLPADVRDAIAIMDGGETVVVGTELGQPFRFFRRPGCAGADEIKRRYDEAFAATDSVAWTSFLQSACNQTDGPIGWKSDQAWPLGQSACLAARLAERFHTTGGVVAGIAAAVRDHLGCARRQAPLASGSALARSHATTFPIVQGPMTRVSDVAPFAVEVARAGALPFIALALMRGAEVDDLLVQTQAALGDRPWGGGGDDPAAIARVAGGEPAPARRPRRATLVGRSHRVPGGTARARDHA